MQDTRLLTALSSCSLAARDRRLVASSAFRSSTSGATSFVKFRRIKALSPGHILMLMLMLMPMLMAMLKPQPKLGCDAILVM
ncbi:hypothetical protein AWZ03_000705 [Drosophila navojoa]|uniref:Uncharacterized protein n=1 Tax=Drosophila navojoa TaxID=7232 RepID=A0A484BZT6_DRONA|nr:hypothetical protein AWZ03_000705 [Drosophila navojoa]